MIGNDGGGGKEMVRSSGGRSFKRNSSDTFLTVVIIPRVSKLLTGCLLPTISAECLVCHAIRRKFTILPMITVEPSLTIQLGCVLLVL